MQKETLSFNPNKQKTLKLFNISNPLSLNNKSIYRQDYQSLLDNNWLRTEAISSLVTLIQIQYQAKITALLQEQFQNNSSTISLETLKENLNLYVKLMDPFIVTMILSTQEDFILQTLQGLNIFNSKTKYILFPMNTDHDKGNHWFLVIFKNPRYHSIIDQSSHQQSEIFILNSIPSSKQDSSLYMANELSQQIIRLMSMFYPQEKKLSKVAVHRVQKITHQTNSYDCGVLTVAFIENFLMSKVFQRQIENFVKLRLWQKTEQKKQERTLDSGCEFIVLKGSNLVRKNYRQRLEWQIVAQNASLL